tara:strand:+ start:14791 stop:18183 length:3393 start_codon:yes stop_codon:yes gene_type:complete
MGNIIGDPFDDFVKRQIETRQKALGQSSNISSDVLKYYTVKTPWLRLASSVNLSGEEGDGSVLDKLIRAGVPEDLIRDDKLAKNFILQGGSLSLTEEEDEEGKIISSKIKLHKGLNYNNEIFDGAYGWGGINERGFVPMPGIESANSTYYNNGALSQSTINIKCYSKAQFQLIDALYLRPGYTLLLEFGWSTYLNSNPDTNRDGVIDGSDLAIDSLQTFDGFKSKPLQFLLKPNTKNSNGTQFEMLNLISNERKKYSGNYEAIYGKITNFKWSFSTDGSYTCEVKLIGMGNVIESLKLNVTDPKKNNQSKNDIAPIEDVPTFDDFISEYAGETIAAYIKIAGDDEYPIPSNAPVTIKREYRKVFKDSGVINRRKGAVINFLRPLYNQRIEDQKTLNQENNNSDPLLANKDDTKLNKIFYTISQMIQNRFSGAAGGQFLQQQGISNGAFLLDGTFNDKKEFGGGEKIEKSVYIKFAVLLRIIEKNCNLFSKKGGGTPMVKFDFNYANMKNDQNFMFICPPNISTNPQKCLVAYNKMSIPSIFKYDNDISIDAPLNKVLNAEQGFLVEDNPYVGKLGNVLINLRFASQAIAESTKDDDGAISVLSYVKTILQGINESMGNLNDFFVTYDEGSGTIKIYDRTPKPNLIESIPEEYSKLNLFGVRQDQGSFITNINLDAEIPKNFATMIAIGAQASGNNLMGNAASFSNYNKGLIDRIIPEKIDYDTIKKKEDKPNPIEQAKTIKEEKIFKSKELGDLPLKEMYKFGGKENGDNYDKYNFSEKVINDLSENYTSYIKLVHGVLAEADQIPSPFFLPFNLSLEMEGLSGMKLFEKFRITDDILPPSYEKDSVDIIVKGINHSVDVQKWSTTLDTQSVPRFKPLIVEPNNEVATEQKSEKQQKLAAAAEEPAPTDPNEDQITRLRLTRLVDNGYQTLGIMEVLDENGNTLYALPTCELQWNDNRNNASCIPTGTYTIASRYSERYKNHFIVANQSNDYKKIIDDGGPITGANEKNRTDVLIHEASSAQQNSGPWLLGCIAPGFKFNTNQGDKVNGNPRGIGPQYGNIKSPSGQQSIEAKLKLVGSLWNTGKNPMFKMEVKALGGVIKPIETNFYSFSVNSEIRRIENITGEKYTYS